MGVADETILRAVRVFLAGGKLNLPEGAGIIWEVFTALHQTRATGMGPAAITFAEIEASARLMRWPLAPHHVSLLRGIDRAWIEHVSRQDGASGAPPPVRQAQPMNPAAFDAVFG